MLIVNSLIPSKIPLGNEAVRLSTLLGLMWLSNRMQHSVDTWKHRFAAECMSVVHDQAFGAKAPSYQTIVQLDRKLRAFPVPSILQISGFGSTDTESPVAHPSLALVMQRHIVLAVREMSMCLAFTCL